MMFELKTKQRFLVPLPFRWFCKYKINFMQNKFINLFFIDSINEKYVYSSITKGEKTQYYYCDKFSYRIVSEDQYLNDYINLIDTKLFRIEKTYYNFSFLDKDFSLYVYGGRLKGLAILECDNGSILPPFIRARQDITDSKRFKLRYLATQTQLWN